eukprot:TRINITY_DN10431_c1_g1_i1.p1 TRINITY_DN10431_c1_g1~~TRINITY_DN10431_c1_g1_i1.p1  ORF type:complete len:408 (-),score=-29.14 TRINITY_DN10431_c1_g1_i1:520-1743(-)
MEFITYMQQQQIFWLLSKIYCCQYLISINYPIAFLGIFPSKKLQYVNIQILIILVLKLELNTLHQKYQFNHKQNIFVYLQSRLLIIRDYQILYYIWNSQFTCNYELHNYCVQYYQYTTISLKNQRTMYLNLSFLHFIKQVPQVVSQYIQEKVEYINIYSLSCILNVFTSQFSFQKVYLFNNVLFHLGQNPREVDVISIQHYPQKVKEQLSTNPLKQLPQKVVSQQVLERVQQQVNFLFKKIHVFNNVLFSFQLKILRIYLTHSLQVTLSNILQHIYAICLSNVQEFKLIHNKRDGYYIAIYVKINYSSTIKGPKKQKNLFSFIFFKDLSYIYTYYTNIIKYTMSSIQSRKISHFNIVFNANGIWQEASPSKIKKKNIKQFNPTITINVQHLISFSLYYVFKIIQKYN